jgi:hypothetical protein
VRLLKAKGPVKGNCIATVPLVLVFVLQWYMVYLYVGDVGVLAK